MDRILYFSEDFCAVSEDGRLTEYIPVRPEDQTGRILRGRVNRMMPGLDAAFVEIGRKRDGFLPLRENSQTFTGGALRSGERILVQIRKEETGTKGAYLTRDLSIPGSLLILMPMNRHVGVSARIRDEELRERLIRTGKSLTQDRFGLVMREASAEADRVSLEKELNALTRRWEMIQEGHEPEAGIREELQRDYLHRGISRIIETRELSPDLTCQLKESALRKIALPHGGNIVIDKAEALTVVDVNSASDAGAGNHRETTLRTNLEACREIMIQTRLRNLSGILILDMIDMTEQEDRDLVLGALEEAFRQDRVKTVIHGFTSLGLIEMTRKRSRTTWQESLPIFPGKK